jgi:hypothetical protein
MGKRNEATWKKKKIKLVGQPSIPDTTSIGAGRIP